MKYVVFLCIFTIKYMWNRNIINLYKKELWRENIIWTKFKTIYNPEHFNGYSNGDLFN